MKIFLPEPEIGDFDGFTPENDILNRSELGEGLSHLIANSEDPLVLALDAQWGAGKTIFLKQWAGELRKAGYPVVFFDAFKHDYVEDAFSAMAAEIIGLVEDHKKAKTSGGKKLIAGALEVTKVVARSALRAGVKIATLNAVDTKDLEEAAKTIGEELSQLEDRYLGEMLTRQRGASATIDTFRRALAELPALLQSAGDEQSPRPLVFIIDELDRCRPVFALEILERVKHFLSVPNVHFIFGAHLEQLKNSVVAAYGSNIDAGIYIQKFIHLTVRLGETGRHKHELSRTRFIEHIRRSWAPKGVHSDAFDFVLQVAEARQFSLRTIERITTNLALAYAFLPDRSFAPPPLVGGLCILKVTEPGLFELATRRALKWDDVRVALCLEIGSSKSELSYDAKWWASLTGGPIGEEDLREFRMANGQYRFSSDTDLLSWLALNVVERLRPVT